MNNSINMIILKVHEQFTGRHILHRLEELNRTQWLSRDQLLARQRDKLISLVEYANKFVPYYQRIFKEVGFQTEAFRHDLGEFNKIPILTKTIIRNNWDDMLTIDLERRHRMSKLSTSGSTGEPLVFMQDNDFRDSATASLQHHIGWAGWKVGDQHALIWGAPKKLNLSQSLRGSLIDWVWNRSKLDAFQLTNESMAIFAKYVQREKPQILYGYATSVYQFARYIRQSPYKGLTFSGIFTTSELLLPSVRDYIEETFRCKVFNRYGTLELGGVACECEAHNGLHISTDDNYVEILSSGYLTAPGEKGDIIVTNLNNFGMPFIRYNVGDVGSWSTENNCVCGRKSPLLASLDGRITNTFFTRDGRIAWSGFAGSAFHCLTHSSIKQFQVIQKSLDKMVVRLVQVGSIPQSVLDEISQSIQKVFGNNVVVVFEFPDVILPLPSGKHQYAISELNNNFINDMNTMYPS